MILTRDKLCLYIFYASICFVENTCTTIVNTIMWIIYTTRMLNELGNDIIALDLMIHQVGCKSNLSHSVEYPYQSYLKSLLLSTIISSLQKSILAKLIFLPIQNSSFSYLPFWCYRLIVIVPTSNLIIHNIIVWNENVPLCMEL